jgi:CDP-glucose 4,6-dehydratase
VQWIVEYLTSRWGPTARWVLDAAVHPHEDHFLRLDCTKAKSIMGWHPALDLPTVLDWIVEWNRAVQAGENLRAVTEAQIDRYESIVESAALEHAFANQPLLQRAAS